MEYLVIGPASMGLFAFMGRLKKYENELKNIKEISGASAGALIGMFLALEVSLDDAFEKLLSLDIEGLAKYKLRSLLKNYGLIDVEAVRNGLEEMYGCNPTFSELKKKFYIAAFNLNRGRTEYFSVESHPDMYVIDAICMSISIPFIAATKPYKGDMYLDGGTKDVMPLEPFFNKPHHKIISFILHNEPRYIEKISSITEYIGAFMNRILDFRINTYDPSKYKTISVNTGEFNLFKFNMSYDDKLRMFLHGFNQ